MHDTFSDFFYKFRNESVFKDQKSTQEAFDHFDKNKDKCLDLSEFENLLKSLFSYNGNSYFISKDKIKKMFNYFKSDKTGSIELADFQQFWLKIVYPVILAHIPHILITILTYFADFITSQCLFNCGRSTRFHRRLTGAHQLSCPTRWS